MPNDSNNGSKPNPRREWTLMFYFASDNPLAPGIVSQLKAVKNAGYHPEVNVIAQFDPHTEGVPVHIFDVNLVEKLKVPGGSRIGSGPDPFVPNLVMDKLWGDSEEDQKVRQSINTFLNGNVDMEDEVERSAGVRLKKNSGAAKVKGRKTSFIEDNQSGIKYDPPAPRSEMSGEMTPEDALTTFLDFCREEYPAKHYVLFILGHGVVVGNDLFLYDEDAREHSLTLKKLGAVLGDFTRKLPSEEEFELISFHSCSMSSLELAYELRGTAKYMIASQSAAFVGSWPYTSILMRILKDAARNTNETETTLKNKFKKIFFYCLYNSYDFLLAGYSFNVTLCDLRKVATVTEALQTLTALLTNCLRSRDERATNLILLAHWQAQSFFNESYTDLYDFCSCLKRKCETANADLPSENLEDIITACQLVIDKLEKGTRGDDDKLIIRSEFAGPAGQYSHGFSVYFPWSAPRPGAFWPKEYEEYIFEETGWCKFLNAYFEKTQRGTSNGEANLAGLPVENNQPGSVKDLLERMSALVFSEIGQLGKGSPSDATGDPPPSKGSPSDPTGGGCECPSIKNYPSFTVDRGEEGEPEDIEQEKKGAKKGAKKRKAHPKKVARKAKAARAAKKGSG